MNKTETYCSLNKEYQARKQMWDQQNSPSVLHVLCCVFYVACTLCAYLSPAAPEVRATDNVYITILNMLVKINIALKQYTTEQRIPQKYFNTANQTTIMYN